MFNRNLDRAVLSGKAKRIRKQKKERIKNNTFIVSVVTLNLLSRLKPKITRLEIDAKFTKAEANLFRYIDLETIISVRIIETHEMGMSFDCNWADELLILCSLLADKFLDIIVKKGSLLNKVRQIPLKYHKRIYFLAKARNKENFASIWRFAWRFYDVDPLKFYKHSHQMFTEVEMAHRNNAVTINDAMVFGVLGMPNYVRDILSD